MNHLFLPHAFMALSISTQFKETTLWENVLSPSTSCEPAVIQYSSLNRSIPEELSRYLRSSDFDYYTQRPVRGEYTFCISVFGEKDNKILLFNTTTSSWEWIPNTQNREILTIEELIRRRLHGDLSDNLGPNYKKIEFEFRHEFVLTRQTNELRKKPSINSTAVTYPEGQLVIARRQLGDWLEVFPVELTGHTNDRKHPKIYDSGWSYCRPLLQKPLWVHWRSDGPIPGSKKRLIGVQ